MAEPLAGRHSWPRRLACLLGGLAAAAAHPPYGFLPGLLGYAAILWALGEAGRDADPSTRFGGRPPRAAREAGLARRSPETSRRLRSGLLLGWVAGVGYFALSLHWLIFPFFVDAKDQAWMAPIAVALTVAGMALFWGAAGLVYVLLSRGRSPNALVFAGALAAAEWLRGNLLTGFPWDLPGETWVAGSPISQAAAVVGAYGLTWITLALASAFAPTRRRWRPSLARAAAAMLAFGCLWLFGQARMAQAPPTPPGATRVRIVQPNISEAALENPANLPAIVRRYAALSASLSQGAPADLVVWPEGAIEAALEDYLAPGTWTRAAVLGSLRPGQTLLLGGYRFAGPDQRRAYNSLAVVRPVAGDAPPIAALYDKYRLVPFGEFMPLDAVVSGLGLKQLVHVGEGFVPGPPPRPLIVAGLPAFQPLICYEALFPGFTRQGARRAGRRPAMIVNISTDAWFGPNAGPLQHFNMARYRSIEEGLPMLRATPTGVSAVVDPFGRPLAHLALGRAGVIDAVLPSPLPPTLYDRLGDTPFWAMLLVSLLAAALGFRRRRAP